MSDTYSMFWHVPITSDPSEQFTFRGCQPWPKALQATPAEYLHYFGYVWAQQICGILIMTLSHFGKCITLPHLLKSSRTVLTALQY